MIQELAALNDSRVVDRAGGAPQPLDGEIRVEADAEEIRCKRERPH